MAREYRRQSGASGRNASPETSKTHSSDQRVSHGRPKNRIATRPTARPRRRPSADGVGDHASEQRQEKQRHAWNTPIETPQTTIR